MIFKMNSPNKKVQAILGEYLKGPSNKIFSQLLRLTENEEGAIISELLYPIACKASTNDIVIRHISQSLRIEGRLVEAEHFLSRWLSSHGHDLEMLRSAAFLSIELGKIESSYSYLIRCKEQGCSKSTLLTIQIAYLLRFNDVGQLGSLINRLLKIEPKGDLYAYPVMLEGALRISNPRLVTQVCTEMKKYNIPIRLGRQFENKALKLVTKQLVNVLKNIASSI